MSALTVLAKDSLTLNPQLREYCPHAFGTWAMPIFLQLREISLTIDLDVSHYLHIITQLDS